MISALTISQAPVPALWSECAPCPVALMPRDLDDGSKLIDFGRRRELPEGVDVHPARMDIAERIPAEFAQPPIGERNVVEPCRDRPCRQTVSNSVPDSQRRGRQRG